MLNPIRLLKQKVSSLDFIGERSMSRDKVAAILESYGFKITNMTEMNGLTYFCLQECTETCKDEGLGTSALYPGIS